MPAWVIGFIFGMCVYTAKYYVHLRHKTHDKAVLVELDPAAARKFLDCTTAAANVKGLPDTLECMEEYHGHTESN